MRIYDLIAKKRDGGTHTRAELETLINGYVAGLLRRGSPPHDCR